MAKPQRKERIPVNGNRDILTVMGKKPELEYRWVLDVPGRLQKFLDGGWEVVQDDLKVGQTAVDSGSKLGSAITTSRGGQTLVLMAIPKEWYDEDQRVKQDKVDAVEETMMRETRSGTVEGQSGFYGGSLSHTVSKSK
jgi:hypothetical protein